MEKSLYELLEIKRKNSTLKSVFITNEIFEDCLILNVEAYDNTGFNALNTSVARFDNFYDYLNKTIKENFDKINDKTDMIRVCIYSAYDGQYIITKDGNIY